MSQPSTADPSPRPSAPQEAQFQPFRRIDGATASGLLIVADHASNALPADYGTLGLPPAELARHIAYDIGVGPLTEALAARLGCPAVLAGFSRLLIDPNRGDDDPTLIMRISDGAVVPGNAGVGPQERACRLKRFWQPYSNAIEAAIDAGFVDRQPPILVSLHSFTPVWRGWPRPWHCGILWDNDPRLPQALLARLAADPALVVGDNEPYGGALSGDTMFRHATSRGLAHAIIEIRQDLLADDAGIAEWTERLAPMLGELAGDTEMHDIRMYGSRTGPVPALGS
ncbi:MAG: N-formylglutamate amidohydrolase [Ancalomicrobiaceae bacterium]|nr:N-formylglutamate amidohydrolase [Ancalomicrobiaceae bacterium]